MCIRYLELQSADGLPPLPTALTWVRDGLLIVGMHSEMRCYNQWNLAAKATHSSDSANERSRDNPVKFVFAFLVPLCKSAFASQQLVEFVEFYCILRAFLINYHFSL